MNKLINSIIKTLSSLVTCWRGFANRANTYKDLPHELQIRASVNLCFCLTRQNRYLLWMREFGEQKSVLQPR